MRQISLVFMSVALSAVAEMDISPVDTQATAQTRALFFNLRRVSCEQVLFGHQHTTAYGVGWENEDNRSDVKDVTGSFPAVYGWDCNHQAGDHDNKLIVEAFERGGINTMSWHMPNLVTGGSAWDNASGTVAELLPGGRHHRLLLEQLDGFARYVSALHDAHGRLVPVIFRPWHEHTGGWFWWGSKSCTPEEYVALWRFTVEYLRDKKNVHNLLWAYSPSHVGITDEQEYETNRFPGYDYIDILGVDVYTNDDTEQMVKLCAVVSRLAEKHGKVAALTEFGYKEGLNNCQRNDWYTSCFLRPLKRDRYAGGIAYALTWRNASTNHFWVPYPGHPAAADFKKFFDDPMTVFENDLPDMYSLEKEKGSEK